MSDRTEKNDHHDHDSHDHHNHKNNRDYDIKITVNQLTENFSINRQMIHRHLHNLIEEGKLKKEGIPPKVYYSIKESINQRSLCF